MTFEIILKCKENDWSISRKFDLATVPQPGWKISLSYHDQEFVVNEIIYDLYQKDIWIYCEPIEKEMFIFIFWDGESLHSQWKFYHGDNEEKKKFLDAVEEYQKRVDEEDS